MTAMPDRLATALSHSYRIQRELGAGGMATVYLAQDFTHRHKIVLQALQPESAHRAVRASVGSTPEHPGDRHGEQS